jgi:uncharacterized protein YukE
MKGESTSIEYEAVKAAVDEIKQTSQSMARFFEEFRASMGRVYQEDVFEGQASESFKAKFNNLKKRFDAYVQTVDDFANVIEGAREATQATEQSIQHAAEDLAE